MKQQTLAKLRVPGKTNIPLKLSTGDLNQGTLKGESKEFPIIDGIPRILAEGYDRYTSESFSAEWKELDVKDDVWGRPVNERLNELKLLEMPMSRLKGVDFLDVGCGNGLFARAIAQASGANVIAVDISKGLELGKRSAQPTETIDFVQTDMQNPPFAPASFDIIWCAGSLHHTPDTEKTFKGLVPLLKPGGRIFVWLYTPPEDKNFKYKVRAAVKETVCRLPGIVQHTAVHAIASYTLVKHFIVHSVSPEKMTVPYVPKFRHHKMMARDSFTVRYDWHLTKEEVGRWNEEAGLTLIYSKYVMESDGRWLAALGEQKAG